MSMDSAPADEARSLLAASGEAALGELFDRYRDRLRGAVQVRLDPRLQGRVDPSDVIQEAFVDARQRLDAYQQKPEMTPFVWIRFLTIQRLMILHRRHLDAKQRDVRREVRVGPSASSLNLASLILAEQPTPSQAVVATERQQRLEQALDRMEPLDREILALRHFEQVDHNEAAEVLEISVGAASQRYYRALKKLKQVLSELFGDELPS